MFLPFQTPIRRALAVVVVALAVVALLVGPAAGPAVASDRGRMLKLVNDDRRDHNRDPLDLSRRLSRRAAANSRRMADRQELSHSDLRAGMTENVGLGPSLGAIERAFMRSDGHRRNLLDTGARRIGVGVVKVGGTFWVTLIFV